MRDLPFVPLLATALLALAGCGDDGAAETAPTPPVTVSVPTAPSGAVEVELAAVEDESRAGVVLLWPEGPEQTRVVVVVERDPSGVYPAALREGPCYDWIRHPPWVLSDVVDGVSESSVDFVFEEMTDEPHSVVVYRSPTDLSAIACANLPGPSEE
jgi:hypothetical protein